MAATHPGFRIFVIGAGFSRTAGLPLAFELFPEVQKRIELRYGRDTKFHRDLADYLTYRSDCEGVSADSPVDLEAFLSYLDIEHFLELRGSDTWSSEGNEAQILIRHAIGSFIHERTPPIDSLPGEYYQFAERLRPNDIVITLNYDIVLERAFEHTGTPYRLFPYRYKSVDRHGGGLLDSTKEEITLLKLHGSLDWFDDRRFLSMREALQENGSLGARIHPVFDDPGRYQAQAIVDGIRPPGDPLLHIHRIRDVDGYYRDGHFFYPPFILSPSHVKFVYAHPLLSFWNDMGRAGGWNLGVSVIGFSLPAHDEYMRIALYQMITNYQQSSWESPLLDVMKDYVRFLDYRTDDAGVSAFKERYRFSDPTRSKYFFGGFSAEGIEFLFDQGRAVTE